MTKMLIASAVLPLLLKLRQARENSAKIPEKR
jgi:hypothetical protein